MEIKKKIKLENGSVTLYTLLSCVFFTIILSSVYVRSLNKLQAQEEQSKQIIENYNKSSEEKLEEIKSLGIGWTITYNYNGGSGTPENVKVTAGNSTTLPTPTKTVYTFDGWYTAATGGTRVGGAGESYTPTNSITLYAHWK